ncbi:MAG: hypothetical protein CO126_06950 [Hydrogenophilales bacterium CG_4_9_14_3_um_filter_63_34]|nr:MAG: hypothetical protein COZ24_07900 [Hydrogenophilales bacterium CG_4_10_14_3_um_filter_63_21]PJB03413.1 MAG: hypothetical protein CO126_06950 [Hydrogenophilales bacterium CG_4_9_14_3_um_filter_63_34]
MRANGLGGCPDAYRQAHAGVLCPPVFYEENDAIRAHPVPAADKTALLEVLRRQFAGAGLRYWVTPVIEAGEIA